MIQLTNEELIGRYKTLLVTLARCQLAMRDGSNVLRDVAKAEPQWGRKSGILSKANAISKQAVELEQVIRRHSMSMRYFFKTVDLKEVATNRIPSDDYPLTNAPPSVLFANDKSSNGPRADNQPGTRNGFKDKTLRNRRRGP